MIMRRGVFGVIGRLMLFVQNNQSEPAKRSKYGGARTDSNRYRSVFYFIPLQISFSVAHPAVKYRDVFSESAAEMGCHLRRQRNFRNKQQRISARGDRLRNQLKI